MAVYSAPGAACHGRAAPVYRTDTPRRHAHGFRIDLESTETAFRASVE